jgi:threonine dehydrogenase-like Zn-dependent dehydrogenase
LIDVLDGEIDPSPILDMTVTLEGGPAGYAAMDKREATRVLVEFTRWSATACKSTLVSE